MFAPVCLAFSQSLAFCFKGDGLVSNVTGGARLIGFNLKVKLILLNFNVTKFLHLVNGENQDRN